MDENKKFYMAVGIFLVIILAMSYYIIQEGQKDSYTVLYFSNPIEPLIYSDTEKKVSVNFTIENHEYMDLEYIYAIMVGDLEIVRKDITVKNNEIAAISEDVAIEEFRQGQKVSVQLYREGFEGVYRRIWSEITF